MPETESLLAVNFPRDGWSSSWGLRNQPRPGAMTLAYWMQTIDATGVATMLNDGVMCVYNNLGSLDGVAYDGDKAMLFSFQNVFFNWAPSFGAPDLAAIDVTFGLWLVDALPVEWGKAYPAETFPTSREPFTLAAPGESPIPEFPGDIPNELTLWPVLEAVAGDFAS